MSNEHRLGDARAWITPTDKEFTVGQYLDWTHRALLLVIDEAEELRRRVKELESKTEVTR